jgi:hypothetical protein
VAVDLRNVEIAGRECGDLPGVDVDEVTLEVEGAAITVDRDLEFVGGMVGQPVRRRLPHLRAQPELADLLLPRRGLSGAERARRMGCEQSGHLVDVLLRDRLVERPLDLADVVDVGLLLHRLVGSRAAIRASAGGKRENEDREYASQQECPHWFVCSFRGRRDEERVLMFTCC